MNADVVVIGAGVFGAWSAYKLRLEGANVLLVDGYGPGNSRASSGGESRVIRLGYGPDEIYSRSGQRSMELWLACFEVSGTPGLFQKTGVAWLAREQDPYCEATITTLQRIGARYERLDHNSLRRSLPQLNLDQISWGIFEPDSGVLLARRAVQEVVKQALVNGVEYLQDAVAPPQFNGSRLSSIQTLSGKQIAADLFVFACGPWLPKLFPDILGELIHVTRQEVFFFGVPPGDERFASGVLPVWIDFNDLVYGIPNVDGRGFKMAIDAHGPEFDPDTGERLVSMSGLKAVREYLAQRVPSLAEAPVNETRVCQYENTSNGDFLIDTHPALENVWLLGGGSGHGFKHGPAVGEYLVERIFRRKCEPRFALQTKEKVKHRTVF